MDIRNATILIVDDNDGTRRLVRLLLRDRGVGHVLQASGVEEALRILFTQTVDLVFTDWEMIGKSGFDLVGQIRAARDERLRSMPIVMMTAHSEEWRVIAARDAGVSDYLVKPIVPAQLELKLKAALKDVREFIAAESYRGPDRRRAQKPYDGLERRATAWPELAQPELPADSLQRLREQFESFLGEAVRLMVADLCAAGEMPETAAECCQRIQKLAHNLKGQGASFGYPLVTDICGGLCDFLRRMPEPDSRSLALLGGYVAVLETVAQHRVAGDGGAIGQKMLARLETYSTAGMQAAAMRPAAQRLH